MENWGDFAARTQGDEDLQKLVRAEIEAFEQQLHQAQPQRLQAILQQHEEQMAFERCADFAGDWLPIAEHWLQTIQHFYPSQKADSPHSAFPRDFYAYKIEQLRTAEKDDTHAQQSQELRTHLLQWWQQRLQERIWAEELRRIADERQRFELRLHERIDRMEELKKLLAPLQIDGDDFGRFWDLARSEWTKTDTRVLQSYAEKLQRNPHLQQLAQLLGRLRTSQQTYETVSIQKKQARKQTHFAHGQKEELIGLRLSQDISQALPSQLAQLADRQTENIFWQDWAARRLLTREYQHKYLTTHYEQQQHQQRRPKAQDEGAMFICVDCSASMQGAPEQIAKTLAFAIARIALKKRRPCMLISFSTRTQTLDLSQIHRSLSQLVEFLSMSFHGGTDATPALEETLRLIQRQEFRRADVLMISDFVMPYLPKNTLQAMQEVRKNLSTKFFSLAIGSDGKETPIARLFDQQWAYDPRDERTLVKLLQVIDQQGQTES